MKLNILDHMFSVLITPLFIPLIKATWSELHVLITKCIENATLTIALNTSSAIHRQTLIGHDISRFNIKDY